MKYVKTYESFLNEYKLFSEALRNNFTNWVRPTVEELKREFLVEQVKKGQEFWDDEKSFLEKAKIGEEKVITKSEDKYIDYRSHTKNKEQLLRLIKSYRSYPKYRNEKTIEAIYNGFKQNNEMTMPIILRDLDGNLRIFAGNTRMDVAFHLGINPKVLIVDTDF